MITRAQVSIGLAAGIGGGAPTVVNLAQGFLASPPLVPGAWFYVGVLLFFLLGAGVALSLKESEHPKAFLLGVSLPAFIAAAQSGPPTHLPVRDARPLPSAFFFISGALAQDRSEPPETRLPPAIALAAKQPCINCEVWFFDSTGRPIINRHLPEFKAGVTTVPVPAGAAQFGVWNDKINPKVWKLPAEENREAVYEFSYEYNKWNDLRRGLGDFNVRPYDAEIKKALKPSP